MTELMINIGSGIIGGHSELFCNVVADENCDYVIHALWIHDDYGDEINLWPMLLIKSFNDDVAACIKQKLEEMKRSVNCG